MADALVIFDGHGALPQKATFQSPTSMDVVFVLTATAWTQNAPTLLGIDLFLDGNSIGGAVIFANNNSNHEALRPTFIPYSGITMDQHTITLGPSNPATVTDVNDYYQVVMLY